MPTPNDTSRLTGPITALSTGNNFGPRFAPLNADLAGFVDSVKVSPFDLKLIPNYKLLPVSAITRLEFLHDLQAETRIASIRANTSRETLESQYADILEHLHSLKKEANRNSEIDLVKDIKLLNAEVETLAERLKQASERQEYADYKWNQIASLKRDIHDTLENVNSYNQPKVAIKEYLDKPEFEDLAGVVEIRDRIAGLKADRRTIENAPQHSATAKQIAQKQIEELAEIGRPNVEPALHDKDRVQFGIIETDVLHYGLKTQQSAFALVAWVFKDQLLKSVFNDIDRFADDDRALDDDERNNALQDLDAKILQAERAEVAAILNSDGHKLLRSDTDFRAFLGIILQEQY